MNLASPRDPLAFLVGGGEMGERTRAFDWSQTPVGQAARWPQSLKTVVRIMLESRYAMWLGWGPEFTFFYNDAYARMTLGPKHPWALGRSAREVWPEIWAVIGPRAESVVRTGKATWDEGLLLFLERQKSKEETYHTFSYSPVPDDSGAVGGMLCVVTEDTERTIGERRLRTLRELATNTTDKVQSAEEACHTAARTLAENPHDLPFALIYLLDAEAMIARLAGAAGLDEGVPGAPGSVDLSQPDISQGCWPMRAVLDSGRPQLAAQLVQRFGPMACGVWPEPPQEAVVLPLAKPGQTRLAGFVVAGISPRLVFNDGYRGFMELLAGQIASAIANARAYEEERKRAEALAELDRAKTAFFSNVSHELRTPLTLMLGPLQDALSRRSNELPESLREDLSAAHRNSLRLLKLVNTLLDFARIEAARVQPNYEPTDLAALTCDVASTFRSAIERANVQLVLDCPPLAQPAFVDREMWEKIVLNLLSNAFKYTFEGEIAVALRGVDEKVELSVRDTGVGIPAKALPRLFERFYRIQGSRARTHEGTGIGLALVQELVKLHGGTIRVESEVDRGTTFFLTLPLGKDHLPADRIAAPSGLASTALGTNPFVEEALRWLPTDGTTDESLIAKTDDALGDMDGTSTSKRTLGRILIADDNEDLRQYLRRLLADQYEVEAVADGEAALRAARSRKPDLILTDVMMPGLDGFGLLREIREDATLHDTPVIMLSARAGEEARVDGVESGADDYLVKPFSAREVVARVRALIETARVRQKESAALSRLNELSLILWRTSSLRDGLDQMLGATLELLQADMGSVQLFDEHREVLTMGAYRGFQQEFIEFFGEVRREDNTVCARALRSGQRVIVKDVESDPLFAEYLPAARAAGFRAVQSTPLIGRNGSLLGILSTHHRAPHRSSDADLRRLDLYLRQAVSFIERVRAEDKEQERKRELEIANARLQQEIEARKASSVIEARLSSIVESSDDAIVSKTLDGNITSWNAGAQALFGYTPDEAIGQSILLVVPPERHEEEATILRKLRNGERINHFETERLRKDGRRIAISLCVSPIRDLTGTIVGASKIARDITAKKRLERERENLLEAERIAREEAQRINTLKDEFLATLSHELRTPLNAILGWAQLTELGTMTVQEMREAGRVIERNARTQKQLIDDLLDMSRIISGKLRLELQQIEPASFIEAAIETVLPPATLKGIHIERLLDPLAGPIFGDPARLQQVIWNLLSNSVKFTPKDGKIQIRLERVNSNVEISISDTGQGIDPAFLPHLFERFRQADASTSRKYGGLGIGLSIVKEIVQLHGGSVRAKSDGEGKGASFIVSLPVSVLKVRPAPTRVHPTASSVIPLRAGLAQLSGLKICFLDDEPDARALVKRLLEECGAEVVTAESAGEALDLIAQYQPDLVISDIGMPEVDGYEFLRMLRASGTASATVPAIALTAFARSEDRTRALLAGYIHHVAKPIEPSELLATIAVVSGRVGEERSGTQLRAGASQGTASRD